MDNTEKIVDRRQLFKDLFTFVGNKVADYASKKVDRVMPKGDYLRPPGAIEETEFLSLCTRCDECIKACPAKAIKRSNGLMDVAVGTPIIVPKENPCVLCNGLLCIAACKEGALKPVEHVNKVRMGVAEIDQSRCLAWGRTGLSALFYKMPVTR